MKTSIVRIACAGLFVISCALIAQAQETMAPSNHPMLNYSFWTGPSIDGQRAIKREDRDLFKARIATCPKAQSVYNTGNMIMIPFYIFGGASLVFDVLGAATTNFAWFAYSLGSIALMVPFGLGASAKYKKATEIHNAQQCTVDASNLKLDVRFSGNGLALALEF